MDHATNKLNSLLRKDTYIAFCFLFVLKISTEKRTFLNLSSFASDNTKYHIKKNNDLILRLKR